MALPLGSRAGKMFNVPRLVGCGVFSVLAACGSSRESALSRPEPTSMVMPARPAAEPAAHVPTETTITGAEPPNKATLPAMPTPVTVPTAPLPAAREPRVVDSPRWPRVCPGRATTRVSVAANLMWQRALRCGPGTPLTRQTLRIFRRRSSSRVTTAVQAHRSPCTSMDIRCSSPMTSPRLSSTRTAQLIAAGAHSSGPLSSGLFDVELNGGPNELSVGR